MLIISIALLEAGHILASRARKISISSFSFDIFGARLDIDGGTWSGRDITIICLCGPLANIFTSLLAIMIFPPCELRETFVFASIALCALNMLPIESFDGYRIACAILERSMQPQRARCYEGFVICMYFYYMDVFAIYTFEGWLFPLAVYLFCVSVLKDIRK